MKRNDVLIVVSIVESFGLRFSVRNPVPGSGWAKGEEKRRGEVGAGWVGAGVWAGGAGETVARGKRWRGRVAWAARSGSGTEFRIDGCAQFGGEFAQGKHRKNPGKSWESQKTVQKRAKTPEKRSKVQVAGSLLLVSRKGLRKWCRKCPKNRGLREGQKQGESRKPGESQKPGFWRILIIRVFGLIGCRNSGAPPTFGL